MRRISFVICGFRVSLFCERFLQLLYRLLTSTYCIQYIHSRKGRKKPGRSFFSIISFNSLSYFLLHQNSYTAQVCIIVIFFRASSATFFVDRTMFFSFLNKIKLYFVPCICWWFYSISVFHAEAFLLHVRFFFNSCRISPVKTKCSTNQWKKKCLFVMCFFFWP